MMHMGGRGDQGPGKPFKRSTQRRRRRVAICDGRILGLNGVRVTPVGSCCFQDAAQADDFKLISRLYPAVVPFRHD